MKDRKEMLDALLAGKTLRNKWSGKFLYMDTEYRNGPFVCDTGNGVIVRMESSWDEWSQYEIDERPVERPMTRDEVLGFITNTPGVKVAAGGTFHHPGMWDYRSPVSEYTYVIVDINGATIDGPKRFVTTRPMPEGGEE